MLSIVLAGLGLWFIVEGAMYALSPGAMKRFGAWLSQLSDDAVRQSGLLSICIGALILYIMLRFGGA